MERGNTIIPCQICHCSEAKYRCPGCDVRTCRYGAFLLICVVSRVPFNKVLGVLKSIKLNVIVTERDAGLHLLARLSSPTTTCSAVSISVFSSIFSVSYYAENILNIYGFIIVLWHHTSYTVQWNGTSPLGPGV